MLFIYYPKCSTCRRAKQFLKDNGLLFGERDIVLDNPTKDELKRWYSMSGYPLKNFFNTSGNIYKQMNLKDKLSMMTEEEQLELLSSNGMLVKRPLLIKEDTILIGFKEQQWQELLQK